MKKIGYISQYEINTIKQYDQILSWMGKVTDQKVSNIELAFYATVFQSGIEEYLIDDVSVENKPSADFVQRRVKYLIDSKKLYTTQKLDDIFLHYCPSLQLLHKIFDGTIRPTDADQPRVVAAPSETTGKKRNSDKKFMKLVTEVTDAARAPLAVLKLQVFLSELLQAMENRTSLITVGGIPSLEDAKDANTILPNDVLFPIRNLLSCIQDEQIVVLNPTQSISRGSIEKFNEIITSREFEKYSGAQLAIEDQQLDINPCVSKVSQTAKQIFRKYHGFTSLKQIGLGVMSLTEQVIDAKYGKIPSSIAKVVNSILGDAISKVLEERRRVTIYNLEPSMSDLFRSTALRITDPMTIPKKKA